MNGFDIESKELFADTMTISVDMERIQLSNNLDAILRDGYGNPIPLDPRDFRHQAYYGDVDHYPGCGRKPKSYVFKGGKLIEMCDGLDEAVWDF